MPQRFRGKVAWADDLLSAVSALIIWVRLRPAHVIVTHQRHLRLATVLKQLGSSVSYDCMDLNLQFDDRTAQDAQAELQLFELADRVFCSSAAIERDVRKRAPRARTQLVRNALHGTPRIGPAARIDVGVARYIGTISTWFSMPTVLRALDEIPELTIELIGPADAAIPSHPRLRVRGPLPHDEVVELMATSEVLLMPFIVTELIEGVDPVKVYEYIASGRPVLCSEYAELAHFGTKIITYRTDTEFIRALRDARLAPRLDESDVRAFVAMNNWDRRAAAIAESLLP